MYQALKTLITRKYYASLEAVLSIMDVLVVALRITPEQYSELLTLAQSVYTPVVEPTPVPDEQTPAEGEQEPVTEPGTVTA